MEENRNNGMNPNMGGMNPNMGRGIPNGMNPNMNGMGGMNPNMAGMNPNMGGMPNAGGMNPNMANPAMAGMNPNGGMNRPPVINPNDAKKAGTPPAGAGGPTSLVPVNKKTQENDKKKKKKRPSVLYNILAVLLFLLMAGGLFLGMITTLGDYPFLNYFSHSKIFLPEKVENTTLTGSLVGIIVDGIMNIQGYLNFGEGLAGVMNALKVILPAVSLLVLAVTVFYGLIAMIIALFSRTNSRRALQVVATCMLVGYGGCGFMTLMFGEMDYISFALAGLGFLTCFIMAIIVNKQIGAMNAFISLFSIGATALFALPWSYMREYALEGTELTPLVVGFVTLGVLYLVFFFTCARVCAKKGKIFDLVMHVLQFAMIVTVFVMTLLAHLSDFTDTMFKFIMPLVCTVGAPALALVTFVLALIIVFMPKMLKKAEAKKAQKAGKAVPAKEKAAKEKKKKDKEAEEQRPMNPPMPFGAPAPAMGQPMRPMPNQPQAQQQPQRPPMQQQPQQPMRPMPNQQQGRPAGRNDEFSRSATSFKVPFTTGGGNGKGDPATQAALEKMAREMQAMKEAQNKQRAAGTTVTVQEDSKTRAAIEQLSEQLRAMKDAQNQAANQGDAATKSAIEQLSEELRAMKDAQNKAEAERKAAEDARIAEAERKAAEAKAEAERIAKEAEAKAEQARLEAAKATEEERKKLEEERRKLEEERKAAEDARLEAERKAAEAKAEAERREAERREAEAKAEAERKAAEAKAEAERKAEEERRKIEEEKRKLEEERKAVEAAKAEAEQKRQDELEQLKRELREMKAAQNQPAPAPAAEPAKPEKSDDDMARIMEELRSLREAQANAGNTTVNYMADDSNKQQLSEFEKRMEDLIRSQNKEPVKREPTAFEKRMAELAARKAALQNGGASAKTGATAAPAAAAAPKPAASNEPARYDTKTFDPFFATLSTAEVNEFGDIFIADKIGVLSYMPAYVIGGDNKDFFRKIMIYLGKFRSQISQGLLEKILKYIRSPH